MSKLLRKNDKFTNFDLAQQIFKIPYNWHLHAPKMVKNPYKTLFWEHQLTEIEKIYYLCAQKGLTAHKLCNGNRRMSEERKKTPLQNMKKNILKSLAMSAIAAMMTACTPRFFIIFTLALSLFVNVKAETPADDEKLLTAADYVRLFDIIDKNIEEYNKINEKLFEQVSKEEWVDIYLQRARQTHQLGQVNQQAISQIFNGIKRDTLDNHFESVILDPKVNVTPFIHDDFLCEEILQNYYDRLIECKDKGISHIETFMYVANRLAAYKHLTSVSGDLDALKQSFLLNSDIIEHNVPGRDIPLTRETIGTYLTAYDYILTHKEFITNGFSTIEEFDLMFEAFNKCLNDTAVVNLLSETQYKNYLSTRSQFISSMLRNVYLSDTTHRYDHIRDSLLTQYVDYYDLNPEEEANISTATQRRLVIMRQKLGRISAVQAIKASEEICKNISKDTYTDLQLTTKINTILECVYFVDISDLSNAEKRTYIKKYFDEILSDLSKAQYRNRMPNMVRSMSRAAVYPRIHKYLDTAERKKFLETLLFYSQPFTRAHSETVAIMALSILNAVIEQRPDLLTGMLGYTTAREVENNPQRIIDFFTDAARYHDLGKTRMPDIIRNEYRPLTDHEFSIIRRHPELGLEYLKIDSTLMEMSDIILGHHKWYNNKGGYPASFDRTKTPYAVLIDILTLADCLEAATSRLGRNYRKNKRYDDVLSEFQAYAGTRYNPEIVRILETHPTLGNQLREITEKGWEDVYYRVFKQKE